MLSTEYSRSSNKKLFIIFGIIIVLLIAAAGFFYWQYNKLKTNPNSVSQEMTQQVTDKVAKLYALPTDEKPTVAQVKDKEKLKDQPFFKNAQNEDYILIYTNTKMALLYREKENKLINVGPIALTDDQKPKP